MCLGRSSKAIMAKSSIDEPYMLKYLSFPLVTEAAKNILTQ